jgi:hypothetical protein
MLSILCTLFFTFFPFFYFYSIRSDSMENGYNSTTTIVDHASPRIQWLIAPKFVHVVLQNQEPSHHIMNADLPKHLEKDGPFLIPITQSIWEPIKVCRLCHDFYASHGMFYDGAKITKGTVIRPAETSKNFRQTQYLDKNGQLGDGGRPNRSTSSVQNGSSSTGSSMEMENPLMNLNHNSSSSSSAQKKKSAGLMQKKKKTAGNSSTGSDGVNGGETFLSLANIDVTLLDRMESTPSPPSKSKRKNHLHAQGQGNHSPMSRGENQLVVDRAKLQQHQQEEESLSKAADA